MSATIDKSSVLELEPAPAAQKRPATHGNPAPRKSNAGLRLLIGVAVAALVVGALLWQRSRASKQLAAETSAIAVPTVSTITPQPGPSSIEIKLPGNLMAYTEASLYARTNGYIKAWYTDIGAKVQQGDLMAEITAPDVDAQLLQAEATLAQAKANLDIAQLNFGRSQKLLATKVISQEDFDQNRTNMEAQQAAVTAAQANVQNLTVMKGFQKITAPFPGVVTKRSTDVGALINAGNAGSQELFHVARTDILRVYISVPEVYAPQIRLDTPAWLELSEFPGVKFQGKVAHIAGGIDPASRTLLTEVQVANADGRLDPGAYATVHLTLKLDHVPSIIPINTVIFRSQGTQVGVVDASGTVHLKSITVGRDIGTSYEVTSGVEPGDHLVLNPSDSIADGEKVHVQNTLFK
ncbi:MAG TPA: efflux RND transporter periplasmic adaptor subunit [Chthoniobacteraceae bacterium]|jgi:RND family efflux transporter MFP subunit|nr:efflux RND transporter periplasmic adaptor subunit [Chthoniobacteraceae bacterium]